MKRTGDFNSEDESEAKKQKIEDPTEPLIDFSSVFDQGLLQYFNSLLVKNDELDNVDYKSYYLCCKRIYSIWTTSNFSFSLLEQTFYLPWKQFYQLTILYSYDYGKYRKNLEIENKLLLDACKKGYSEVIPLLINNGANVDTNFKYKGDDLDNNETPLYYACENGHVDVVKLLGSLGCQIDDLCLYAVGLGGNYEIIKYLIDKKIDLTYSGLDCLILLAEYGQDLEGVKLIYRELRKLKKKGIEINEVGDDTLVGCCRGCSIEILDYLVDKGLNPNGMKNLENSCLNTALSLGNFQLAKHLISIYKTPITRISFYSAIQATPREKKNIEITEDEKVDMYNFLFENYPRNSIPSTVASSCAEVSLENKWYKLLVWFLKKGATIDPEYILNIVKEGNFNLLILISEFESGKNFDLEMYTEFEKNVK